MDELVDLERRQAWLDRWSPALAVLAGACGAAFYVKAFLDIGTVLAYGVTAVFVTVATAVWVAASFVSSYWEARADRLRRRPGVPNAWGRQRRR
jgi:hypothetical protein